VVAVADQGAGPLGALVSELPDDERRAVLSRVVAERSYKDIAGELSCSEMVVRKRVSRGLSRLRRQLGRG
jgi:RNA polymerase sigma-70 factor (ECF subfamily)